MVDGNIWSSFGISPRLDVTFAFISTVYGATVAEEVANMLEYERHTDPSWDPFAELAGLRIKQILIPFASRVTLQPTWRVYN